MDYDKIQAWLEALLPARPTEMAAMEQYAEAHDFPIIGPLSGQLCLLVARLIGATRIFELGSGFGYSTAWFGLAVRANVAEGGTAAGTAADAAAGAGAVIHHTVWDEELSAQAQANLAALGVSDLVTFHVSEAVAALEATPGLFDIIFMDIDKEGYPAALQAIERKLRPGGVLIVDNMLWHGQAYDPADHEASTEAIRTLATTLFGDARWTPFIAPVRDGVLLARYGGGQDVGSG